jgi:hypothetical protein
VGSLGIDTGGAVTAADVLTRASREITAVASGVDRFVPPLPDDDHGVVLLIVGFDEARERFDQALGAALADLGDRLALQVMEATAADQYVALPVAGR